jgi:hypothetical protein
MIAEDRGQKTEGQKTEDGPRTAWLETRGDIAIVCAWCVDEPLATKRAMQAGLRVSHGICPECCERMKTEVNALFFAQESREISEGSGPNNGAGNPGKTSEET